METPPHMLSRSRSCSPDSSGSSPRPTNGEDYRISANQGVLGNQAQENCGGNESRQNHVSTVVLRRVPIVSLFIDGKERLCLAQISNTLLRDYSYNEIHNRRVALGITCIQCTPVQLEILRRQGAMPVSSRRCGMITKREAERLVKSFLEEIAPPKLPENFAFDVIHTCGWGCRGFFLPSRYNSSRAKCIKCYYCNIFFSPNKFIFHCHRMPTSTYRPPDAANFNSWRRHIVLSEKDASDDLAYAWEDVKAMFNGGSRKRVVSGGGTATEITTTRSPVDDEQPEDSKRPCLETVPALPQRATYPYHIFPMANPSYGFYGNFFQRQPSSHPAFPYLTMERQSFGHAASATSPSSPPQERCKFNMADILRGSTAAGVSPYSLFWEKNFENRQMNFPYSPKGDKKQSKYLAHANWSNESSVTSQHRDNKTELIKDFSLKNRNQQQAHRSSAFKAVTNSDIIIQTPGKQHASIVKSSESKDTHDNPGLPVAEDLSVHDVQVDVCTRDNIPEPLDIKATAAEKLGQTMDNRKESPVSESKEAYKSDAFREEIQRLVELREKADHEYKILKETMYQGDMNAEDIKNKLSEAQNALREFAARIDAIKEISSLNS